jgi:AraC-like DNA-binding protein
VRRSKPADKPLSKQTWSTDAGALVGVGVHEQVYESTKLAAVFDALVGRGISAGEILRGVNLPPEEVHSSKTRISKGQLMATYKNAVRLSTDPHLPYHIGRNIHVSTYGMYGYAILCCPDFRRVMDFAISYHALAAPLVAIDFREEGMHAAWSIEPIQHTNADRQLYRFITELQIGVHISLMRDVMGADFVPEEICLAYSQADDFSLKEEIVGCSIRFAQPSNRLVFKSEWLDRTASLGNRTTYAAIVELCDQLLGDLKLRTGTVGKIRAILLRDIANPPSFDATAKLLDVNARSLRRQLQQQGISFRELLDELRTQLALKYLRNTHLPVEDIALALGFSDAASFRRAFNRWTGKAPSRVREEE